MFQWLRLSHTFKGILFNLFGQSMDHRKRRLPIGARSLEAHHGAFVVDRKRLASATDAKRRAPSTPYGAVAETVRVAGLEGRGHALGPEPAPDDMADFDVEHDGGASVVWQVIPFLECEGPPINNGSYAE